MKSEQLCVLDKNIFIVLQKAGEGEVLNFLPGSCHLPSQTSRALSKNLCLHINLKVKFRQNLILRNSLGA